MFKIQFRIVFSVVSIFCWFLLGTIVTGFTTHIASDHYTHFTEKDRVQYLSVRVEEQNNSNERNRKYTAEVQSVSYQDKQVYTSGKILLLLDKGKFDSILILGNEYRILARIQKIPPALNPHQFDYGKYLERKYILRTGTVEKIISQEAHSSFWYRIKNSNQLLAQKVDESVLSQDSKEFLKAYLLGDRSEMKKDMIDAYSKAGIMHLIAISGTHIVFIFSMVFSVFSLFLGRKNRKITIIGSLVFVWLFGCFVGLSSSVFRSCLMITIYYVFELLKRISNIYHSLSLSAILILLCDPYEIYSVGFQLSYAAVFFMCWLSPLITRYLKTGNKKINQRIMEPLSVTLAAQLGTLPLVVYYFHQFSLLSVPINILIIPYTFVITYSSVLELIIVLFPAHFQYYPGQVYDFLVLLLVESSRWISSVNFFLFRYISVDLKELTAIVFSIILLRYFLKKPQLKAAFPFLICLALFQLIRLTNEYKASKKENLIVFDNKYPLVGFREGKNLLLLRDERDNQERIGSYIIEPYITGERINKVEYKSINYERIYSWKSQKIQILNKKTDPVSGNLNYLVLKEIPERDLKSNGVEKVIVTGTIYPRYEGKRKDVPEIVWIIKEKGIFNSFP